MPRKGCLLLRMKTSASRAHFSGDRPASPSPTPHSWMDLQFDYRHGNSEFWHMKVGGSPPFGKVFPACLKGQVWQLRWVLWRRLAWAGPGDWQDPGSASLGIWGPAPWLCSATTSVTLGTSQCAITHTKRPTRTATLGLNSRISLRVSFVHQ